MEPLWSPVVATSGKRWQMPGPGKPQKQAKSVAIGCHRLRSTFHGKEGVDGSSPSEGSAKAPHAGFFFSDRFADYGTWGRYGALYGAFRSRTPLSTSSRPGGNPLAPFRRGRLHPERDTLRRDKARAARAALPPTTSSSVSAARPS